MSGHIFGVFSQTTSTTRPSDNLFATSVTQTGVSSGGGFSNSASLFGKPPTSSVFLSQTIFTQSATTSTAPLFGKASPDASSDSSSVALAGDSKPSKLFSGFYGQAESSDLSKYETFGIQKKTVATSIFNAVSNNEKFVSGLELASQGHNSGDDGSQLFGKKEPSLFGRPPSLKRKVHFGDGADAVTSEEPSWERSGRSLFGKEAHDDTSSASSSAGKPPSRAIWSSRSSEGSFQGLSPVKKKLVRDGASDGETEALSVGIAGSPKNTTEQNLRRRLSRQDSGSAFKRLLSHTGLAAGTQRRRIAADDIANKVILQCINVPPAFNNKGALKKHFSQFGSVTRIYPTPQKNKAVIHFSDHEAAKKAKADGRWLGQGHRPITILWRAANAAIHRLLEGQDAVKGEEESEVPEYLEAPSERGQLKWGRTVPAENERSVSPASLTLIRTSSPVPSWNRSQNFASLRDTVALTSSEKYQVLEKRDKLIRAVLGLHMKQQTELKKAKVLIGSCMDMCPEKERYQREDQRRLSAFEVLVGLTEHGQNPKVDHMRAVKEYSRSSADQDLPLPQELRPVEVLEITMTYLLREVVPQGREGLWAEWFDFLWNRTRGIRKDITQQQLCDERVVSLVETCARFHMFCREALCELPALCFDARLNNENLTKCLQTLKELYHDLAMKKCQYCHTEAEFRGYIILMNLNSGDVLGEVTNLRPEVRSSNEVKFALAAHSAINSNNFMSFFQLVEKANFMQTCVLHSYFIQVRLSALRVIVRAYRPQYPVSEFARKLLFTDDQEALEFCLHYGISVDTDGRLVLNERTKVIMPEEQFRVTRASHVIDSKRVAPLEEIINGGVLLTTSYPIPIDSFDSSGRFILSTIEELMNLTAEKAASNQEDLMASVSDTSISLVPVEVPAVVEQPVAMTPGPEDVKVIAKEMFREIIDDMVNDIAIEYMGQVQHYLALSVNLYEDIVQETLPISVINVVESALDECRREKQEHAARYRAEMAAVRAKAVTDIIEDIVTEGVQEFGVTIAKEEFEVVQAQLNAESEERSCHVVASDLVLSALVDLATDVSTEVYQTDVLDRMAELDHCQRCVELLVVSKYWRLWKTRLGARVRLGQCMLNFPSVPSLLPATSLLKQLLPHSCVLQADHMALGPAARLTLKTPQEVCRIQDSAYKGMILLEYKAKVRHYRAWLPLDLTRIVKDNLPHSKSIDSPLWKLLVSVPQEQAEDVRWITSKLSKGAVPSTDSSHKTILLSLYTVPGESGVCVKSVIGQLSDSDVIHLTDQGCAEGTSALMFVLPALEEGVSPQSWWQDELTRLTAFVNLAVSASRTPIPLQVLIIGRLSAELTRHVTRELCEVLEKTSVKYSIHSIEEHIEENTAAKQLSACLEQLCSQCLPVQLPSCASLEHLIGEFLQREYSVPVYQDLASRKKRGLLHQPPDVLLGLYNSIIQHVSEVVSSSRLLDISWPIPEFTSSRPDLPDVSWNHPSHLESLGQLILDLQLPPVDSQVTAGDSWQETVWDFLDTAVGQHQTAIPLRNRIQCLLSKVEARFDEDCLDLCGEEGDDPVSAIIPWTDIIEACVTYKLQQLPGLQYEEGDHNALVYYMKEDLNRFVVPKLWLTAMQEREEDGPTLGYSCLVAVQSKHTVTPPPSPKVRPLSVPLSPTLLDMSLLPGPLQGFARSHRDLRQVVQDELLASTDFEQYLERLVIDGEKILTKDQEKQLEDGLWSGYRESVTSHGDHHATPGWHGGWLQGVQGGTQDYDREERLQTQRTSASLIKDKLSLLEEALAEEKRYIDRLDTSLGHLLNQ